MVAMILSAKTLEKKMIKSPTKISVDKLSKTTKDFIELLAKDYPGYKIERGEQEHWSPKTGTISFNPRQTPERVRFGVLHELAHALLEHTSYQSDF